MNTSATRTYIAQLPWSCKTRFSVLFKKEIENHTLSLVQSDSCFMVMTDSPTLYYDIKYHFPEAIGV